MHGTSILRKTHCTAYHAWDEQGQTVQEKEREYGERQPCMEGQLLPQYPPVMACFSAQAITSGLKLGKMFNLLPRQRGEESKPVATEVDKVPSPGAGDNMPAIVRVGVGEKDHAEQRNNMGHQPPHSANAQSHRFQL